MEFYQEKLNRLETCEEGAIQISIEHAVNDNESGGRLTLTIIDSGKRNVITAHYDWGFEN